jgi:hypothetical protein
MMKSISRTEKKRGRGRPKTGAISIHLRIEPKELGAIDTWRAKQSGQLTRPEAIRRLIEQALAAATPSRPVKAGSGRKAAELAGRTIDRLGDPAATDEERAHRKRRLIKGPREFRDVLVDQPKKKG